MQFSVTLLLLSPEASVCFLVSQTNKKVIFLLRTHMLTFKVALSAAGTASPSKFSELDVLWFCIMNCKLHMHRRM